MFCLRNLHQDTVFVSVTRIFLLNYSKDSWFQLGLLFLQNKVAREAIIFGLLEDGS